MLRSVRARRATSLCPEASTAITAVFGMSCLAFGVTGGILGQSLWNQRWENLRS